MRSQLLRRVLATCAATVVAARSRPADFLPPALVEMLTDSASKAMGGDAGAAYEYAELRNNVRRMTLEALAGKTSHPWTKDTLRRVLSDNSTYEPQQLHLSCASDPTLMFITWVTNGACAGSVTYAAEAGGKPSVVPAVETSYTAGIFGWNGTIHTATMVGLTPGALYSYSVGCPSAGIFSAARTFTAPPVPAANLNSFVCVTADMGTIVPLGWAVAEEIITEHFTGPQRFDLIITAGDLSYATVDPPKNEIEFTWDSFNIQNEPFASTAPWQTVVGNHEDVPGTFINSTGSYPIDFAAFTARYRMPGPESGGNGNMWFSFDYGPAHYASISSEANFTAGAPEWLWLQKDLAAANARRNVTPWLVVMLHRPILSADNSEYVSHHPGAPLSAALEPLLMQYGVDIVLQGHEHCYERTQAVYNGTVMTYADANNTYTNPGAPIYIVQGTSGAMQEETFVTPTPDWSAVRSNGVYGFGRMTINGTARLFYEFVDIEGVVHDSWTILKN